MCEEEGRQRGERAHWTQVSCVRHQPARCESLPEAAMNNRMQPRSSACLPACLLIYLPASISCEKSC